MRHRLFVIALLGVTGFVLGPGVRPALAQPGFKAIDMFKTDLGALTAGREAPQVQGETPLILVVEDVGAWYVRAMTVEAASGARLGRLVDITVPPSPCYPPNPCKILYSEHFLPGQVIVLGDDMALVTFPISIMPDGSPEAGAPLCHPPDPGVADLGPACAMTEMPGSAFGDGMARLFVGTQSGVIARFVIPMGGEPTLEGVVDLLLGQPIASLGPIPQMAGPVLGAAVGTGIVGIADAAGLPAVQFTSSNPDLLAVVDFVAQNPGPPDAPVYIAFCDGVNIKVPRAVLPADAAGASSMDLVPPDPIIPILTSPPVGLALGSLLMLTEDGQGVYYDPGFDLLDGPSGCIADVNDPEGALCVECFINTGDVNMTGNITSQDIILLVNFAFKGGPAPQPCEQAGDVNCSGTVTAADIIYLVNFVFKGAAPPCDVCSELPGHWYCL